MNGGQQARGEGSSSDRNVPTVVPRRRDAGERRGCILRKMQQDIVQRALAETLEGRLPVLPSMRIYSRFASFMWTCAAFGCASYAYLVGTSLATIGNTWVAIVGYWLGTMLGMAIVSMAVGVPCFRYGIDTVDAAKGALGVRGALVFMLGIVLSCLGWGNVLVAMTARMAGAIVALAHGRSDSATSVNAQVVVAAALVLTGIVWWLSLKGPRAVEVLTRWGAPSQIAIAALLLALMLGRHSLGSLLTARIDHVSVMSPDPHLQLTLAIEFGWNNGFTMAPFLGGITRLVAHRRIVVTPPVFGYATGAAFISGVAAMATAITGATDPMLWLTQIAGPWLSVIIMGVIIMANVGALVAFVYIGAISIQQLGVVSKLPWRAVTAIVIAPSLIVAFRTQAMLDSVMQLLTYNGVMFIGVTGVLLADYYLLRRQSLSVVDLFTMSRRGKYWYWQGVNWIAVAVLVGATAAYLLMFDPVTLRTARPFYAAGAVLPVLSVAIAVYLLAMRLSGIARRSDAEPSEPLRVEL